MNGVTQSLRQVRFTNTAFWRNPASAFFTFAFPLMFLVIFTALLGHGTIPVNGLELNQSTYYVVSMASFAVITACYTNIAISVTFQRDSGVLKRTRGTPLPSWSYLSARVLHAMIIAFVLVIICGLFGKVAYGADVPTGVAFLQTIAIILVASMSFAALGLAVTAVIPNADASPPIVNATVLPLLFLSGVFIPVTDSTPAWVRTIAAVFPVKHFVDAFMGSYYGQPFFVFHWKDVAIVAVWGIAGLILAARFFSWEPRK
jgi:ABC-2 type transport system permease protein